MSDREVVVAFLHYKGMFRTVTSKVADKMARLLCDGFGQLSEKNLNPKDLYPLYDWSHVRDSSDEGIAQCAAYLRHRAIAWDYERL